MLTNSDYHEVIGHLSSSIAASTAYAPQRKEAVAMDELPVGSVVEVETGYHTYRVENRGEGRVLISGHPDYCPEPVLVEMHGSVASGSMLKMWLIESGSKMEFEHPNLGVVRTSRVRAVRELKKVGVPS